MKTIYSILPVLTACIFIVHSCKSETDDPALLPDAKPIVLRSEYATKTINNRSFALDFFKTTVAESGNANIFISPYSVNMALNMAWNGTTGGTENEMRMVLGNGEYTKDQINDYTKSLTDALLKADPTSDLKIANSIWAHNTTPFKLSFVQTNKAWYNAKVKNVDFTKQETRDAIDKWCRENTGSKIDKISEGMTENTRFALINAIYFKAKWKHQFDKSETHGEIFTNSDGTQVTVQMMNQNEDLFYSNDDTDWKMLSMPYGNRAFSMVILMPLENEPLDAKIATLTVDKFYELFNTLDNYSVTVRLPRFKAECSYELHKKILPAMGIQLLFDPERADMNEMCKVPIFVNTVMHKTHIDVYEEGTEADSVTSESVTLVSIEPEKLVYFYVNRPFIYSIVENSTGTILFMGRVNKF